jgi:hypothetical protein
MRHHAPPRRMEPGADRRRPAHKADSLTTSNSQGFPRLSGLFGISIDLALLAPLDIAEFSRMAVATLQPNP